MKRMEASKRAEAEALRARWIDAAETAVRMGFVSYALMLAASALISLGIPGASKMDLHQLANACGELAIMATAGFFLVALVLDTIMPDGRSIVRFERSVPGQLTVKIGPVDWVRLIAAFLYIALFMTAASLVIRYAWTYALRVFL